MVKIVSQKITNDVRIMSPQPESHKPANDKRLHQSQNPAYKNDKKCLQESFKNLPDDLVKIIDVWAQLPEKIKMAIKILAGM